MRIIMIAISPTGDVSPFIGLGRALKRRGHSVTLCSLPAFAAEVEGSGLAFVPLCDEASDDSALSDPRLWDPKTSFAVLWRALCGLLEPVYDYVAAQRDEAIVVGSQWALGARIAQEKYGIPYLTVQVSPSTLLSAHLPPVHPQFNVPQRMPLMMRKLLWRGIEYLSLDRTCAPQVNALRHKNGLGGTVRHLFSQWMHSPDGVICLFPEWFAPVQEDWPQPLCMAGFPLFDGSDEGLDEPLRAFLEAGTPPILFTLGSTRHFDERFYTMAASVLTRIGARGIFLTGHRAPLDGLPGHILQRPCAPMAALLPHTTGLVHPAGIGAMSQALAAGIPQLVLPMAHDQFDNAERLVRLGCGLRLDLPLDEVRLRNALAQLQEDIRMRAACAHARRRLADPQQACEQAVNAIERCYHRGKHRRIRAVS